LIPFALLLTVAAILIGAAGCRWLLQPKVRVRLVLTALTVVLLGMLTLASSCGGGGSSSGPPPNPGTPAGNYNLTVTATLTSGSATLAHAESLTLDVQ